MTTRNKKMYNILDEITLFVKYNQMPQIPCDTSRKFTQCSLKQKKKEKKIVKKSDTMITI